ncbi:MAG TPA: hypothetical protein PKK78_17950 [Kouleothrix sp.]|nr:hypothetical protein [Kouleothrix sp.]
MLQQSAQSSAEPRPRPIQFRPLAALQRAYATNRTLTLLGVLMLVALAASILGLLFDPRTITGVPAWLKPFKFAVSISLYAFTLIWILSFVQGRRFWLRLVSGATLVILLGEMVLVITQVLRGTTSHFNRATPFDTAMFSAMGMMISALWVIQLIAALLLIFQRLPDRAFAWSLRLGLLLALVGAALGFLMTTPSAAQLAQLQAGAHLSVIGAHSVGVPDGGPGLPITGWSSTGGDLRISHFIGLHALQILPLLGLLLTRTQLGTRRRLALVWVGAASYLGLTALVAWQALRGQPLLAPDATTLMLAAAWLGATLLAAALAWRLPAPLNRS